MSAGKFGPCNVPVALIIFNRPQVTARVFEMIRKAQPRQLFVIADGPRNKEEERLCAECRDIATRVDWDCKLITDFSPVNLGCGRRPASGISWVFSQVEEAIILEDDCIPAASFFAYCATLLARYRSDERIMHISGNNFLHGRRELPWSYYFSKYTCNWGWATWRRAWQHYDYELKTWAEFQKRGFLQSACPDPIEAAYWKNKLDTIIKLKRDDVWDYQWNYSVWAQGGLSILPSVNLISNQGFGHDATHTKSGDVRENLPVGEIPGVIHPEFVVQDRAFDRVMFDEVLGGRHLRERHTLRYRLTKPARIFRRWQRG